VLQAGVGEGQGPSVHIADAAPQAGAPGTVTYRLNFQAWCVFLLVIHHVPVERCADILGSMSGTRPSDGRDLASFKGFVYSDLYGTVIVHDRYQNCDSFDGISHQLCSQHLLRDLEDAARDLAWPDRRRAARPHPPGEPGP
jgi:hypothetical protein